MRVAVAGGTGLTGALVVDRLRRAGHEPVPLARSLGTDLVTGAGLDDALAGCGAVVDVSNVGTQRRSVATAFFGATAGHLAAAAGRAGVAHVVVLSIVGVDRVDLGYYAGKRRQEEVLGAGPVACTVLRTTQFHEFAGQLVDRAAGPVVPVPRMLCRPVAAGEVADRLVELATTPTSGPVRPLAGPGEQQLVDMVRAELRRRGARRLVLPLAVPGAAGRGMRTGALLPEGPHDTGRVSFADHLAAPQRWARRGDRLS